ncbi:MAG: hypothetical protein VKK32_06440 [Candidatus Melainabacteria bacterium]|nr:hypothetical protein [Candidatus Melainabacteria bacterium]
MSNLPTIIYIEDFKISLKEIYKDYSTYVLDEQYQERILAEVNQDGIHKQSQNKKRLRS